MHTQRTSSFTTNVHSLARTHTTHHSLMPLHTQHSDTHTHERGAHRARERRSQISHIPTSYTQIYTHKVINTHAQSTTKRQATIHRDFLCLFVCVYVFNLYELEFSARDNLYLLFTHRFVSMSNTHTAVSSSSPRCRLLSWTSAHAPDYRTVLRARFHQLASSWLCGRFRWPTKCDTTWATSTRASFRSSPTDRRSTTKPVRTTRINCTLSRHGWRSPPSWDTMVRYTAYTPHTEHFIFIDWILVGITNTNHQLYGGKDVSNSLHYNT